jgi:hypothetical protein
MVTINQRWPRKVVLSPSSLAAVTCQHSNFGQLPDGAPVGLVVNHSIHILVIPHPAKATRYTVATAGFRVVPLPTLTHAVQSDGCTVRTDTPVGKRDRRRHRTEMGERRARHERPFLKFGGK